MREESQDWKVLNNRTNIAADEMAKSPQARSRPDEVRLCKLV
jgi:hypothetical protein